MEKLCPSFDLNSPHLSPIFTKFPKPTSILCYTTRISCSNRSKYHECKVSTIPQTSATKIPTSQLNNNSGDFVGFNQGLTKVIGRGLVGFAAALAVCIDSPALAESLTVAFPVSRAHEVNTVQRTLVEAWGLIRETFVDPTFNHQDWDMKLQQTMVEMFPLSSADAAYKKISGMLATLGDPFTRIISPKEYQSFRIGSDGNLQGVGLFVNVEPKTGHLVVMSCVEGSPAARAGIHEGDELVEINGERLDGISSEGAAQKLRGRVGTTVTVKVSSGDDSGSNYSFREVNLLREFIKLSPISSAIIPHRTPDGHLSKTGYVKLLAFSQTAASDMENAINELENQGVQSYILDLRNNPGGLVKAGLDIAQIWLDGDETLVNTIDRDGNMLPINMVNGHALTRDPLVVLVNEGSASASEILAGALHDNGRAKLVGRRTFGKGKIQSVTELQDGSALFITVAKYLSPALHDIDQVGIAPDVQCTTARFNSPKEPFMKNKSTASSLEADSCIMVAEHELDIQGEDRSQSSLIAYEPVADEEKPSASTGEDDKDNFAELLNLPPHGSEVFIGALPRDVTEEELRDLCQSMGEIFEIRLMKNRDTGEGKGFAFVAFKTKDIAQKAIEELHNKDFKGRTLRFSLSETKYRLFVGNIPKNWTDDEFRNVIDEVGPGAENIELIKDPQNPSRNRGFAFIEYYNNSCADYSRQKMLSAKFKLEGNAPTVTWADPKITPDHSASSQVKALYVKNIPENTSSEQLKELFQHHGEVTKVVMPPAKSGGKRDFGFVHFAERSSALKAVKDTEKYEVSGQLLEVVLARPQSDKKSDGASPHNSGPHPNYIPNPGYSGFPNNPYGPVGAGYGVTAGFQQPMIYGRGPMPAGMQMVPMVLPDGRIGYVLQQPGVQMPPMRARRNAWTNGSGGPQGRGPSGGSDDGSRGRRYRPY